MFSWPVTVYYEDTDAGGVVYHSNYLNFFERARTEWMKNIGISQTNLLTENVAFVVKHCEVDFKIAARFEQCLKVVSKITEMKRASMTFHQALVDDDGKLYCEATIVVACVNLSKMKPIAVPKIIIQELMRAS
ncbi:tol-pal system-associated acyl-CoA thioesterase [Parashewanella spongiae]|uniref:Tol-pal system-associated acyl-CoA thioesterase n=1 Tax=Parashewanella spongiae TaxID=342950 RepID=A0A3A6UAL9_9GAMM|nr:tol-pal system-associated acyl-CoA thioesterase [Parashewanella spongiae]MCL1078566.1 tol-pal system-associated acyl-CoA thioesterase [Parashewanella spongiae]RJY19023.1 tol-pal system-associated acyl-CoA thioesterase [Parashewanella spongiae]